MEHDLKIWPQYYCRVADGTKTFEVRKNDRGFQPGDSVWLREYNPAEVTHVDHDPMGTHEWKGEAGYTGARLKFKIGYVLPIDDERVVFSLLPAENNT